MSADILVGMPFLPSCSKHDEIPPSPEVSLSMLETWLSSYSRPSTTAAPIVASTITIEAIQNLLHATGFPIEAPSIDDVYLGPFEDTQFDAVVDVETSGDSMEDLKFTDLDTSSEYDYSGSDFSEDDLSFFQDLPLSPDSPLLSDAELDFASDSGIEAEMDEPQDGTENKEEKEKKNKTCDDKKGSEDSTQETTSTEEDSKPVKKTTTEEPEEKVKDKSVEQKMEEDEDGLPVFHCQYLWEFLHHLLSEKHYSYIIWKNQSKGVFRLIDHNGVANLWGRHKKRKNMTYEKLSRALRYYYSKNILKKVPGQRLTYKFVRNLNGKKYPM